MGSSPVQGTQENQVFTRVSALKPFFFRWHGKHKKECRKASGYTHDKACKKSDNRIKDHVLMLEMTHKTPGKPGRSNRFAYVFVANGNASLDFGEKEPR